MVENRIATHELNENEWIVTFSTSKRRILRVRNRINSMFYRRCQYNICWQWHIRENLFVNSPIENAPPISTWLVEIAWDWNSSGSGSNKAWFFVVSVAVRKTTSRNEDSNCSYFCHYRSKFNDQMWSKRLKCYWLEKNQRAQIYCWFLSSPQSSFV